MLVFITAWPLTKASKSKCQEKIRTSNVNEVFSLYLLLNYEIHAAFLGRLSFVVGVADVFTPWSHRLPEMTRPYHQYMAGSQDQNTEGIDWRKLTHTLLLTWCFSTVNRFWTFGSFFFIYRYNYQCSFERWRLHFWHIESVGKLKTIMEVWEDKAEVLLLGHRPLFISLFFFQACCAQCTTRL